MRFVSALVVSACAAFAGAQAPEPPSRLPIEVPHGAEVTFEADAPASEMLPVLSQLFSGGMGDPTGDKITIKTGLGDIDVSPKDLAPILRPIRELHIVSYSNRGGDPFRRYGREFEAEGLERVAYGNGVLVMRRGSGRYAVVTKRKDKVTVVRTDGMPDLGAATHLVLEEIARAAEHAVGVKRPVRREDRSDLDD